MESAKGSPAPGYHSRPHKGALISFEHVSYRYQPTDLAPILALRDVSLSIEAGEFVAVVGANGSGKSTFARLAGALLLPQSGRVRAAGQDTALPASRPRLHATVGMVFQYPEDQIVSTSVEEDAAFGPENLALPPEEIRARVEAALREVGLWDVRRRPPHLLSAGQVQRVALAGVLAMRPRCIIFDEASTMLDPAGRRALMEAVHRLNREGVTIILITHFMEEAAQAGRVIVFSHGQVALDGPPREVFADPARLAALRLDLPPAARLAADLRGALPGLPEGILLLPDLLGALPNYPGPRAPAAPVELPVPTDPELAIEVSELGYVYLRGTPLEQRALDGANLRVTQGGAHGLLGMTGSGKSTLLQHLNALLRPQEGRVRSAGFDLNDPHVDRRQVIRKVGLVFQNPEAQFFEHFAGDEIAYGPRQLMRGDPSGPTLAERVRWAMQQVGLDFETFKDRPLFALSGGERRKVALASTLALRPSILLLDEPTAGLDPHSRLELLENLRAMHAAGMTLVLSSHHMDDLAALADDLSVFNLGRDVLSGAAARVFAETEVLSEYGLEPPPAVQLAQALAQRGWPLPPGLLTGAQIAAALRETRSVP